MGESAIAWTDKVWNPVIGCTRVSAGCEHCYAMNLAPRLAAMGQSAYEGLTRKHSDGSVNWTGEVRCLPERLDIPLGWKKPARVFVNSMSDLFHEAVPDEFIAAVFGIMAVCDHLTFQVLTKRPKRMQTLLGRSDFDDLVYQAIGQQPISGRREWHDGRFALPLPNAWLGVSTENQDAADERIPILLDTPSAVRFISAEPLLGPIDLLRFFQRGYRCGECGSTDLGLLEDFPSLPPICRQCGGLTESPLDWVITGGESGKNHRPFDPQWAKDIRDQCQSAGVAFFHKQSGGPRPGMGEELDGRLYREFPRVAVPA